jgi:transaldolase/glucose-6-phosphate isomerase
MNHSLPPDATAAFNAAVQDWTSSGKVNRFWNRDKSLWTSAEGNTAEDKWMGWLDIAERQAADSARFREIAAQIEAAGYRNAVLLGMGGSSLCPEVLSVTFGHQPGFPALHILDSTDPAQVKSIERLANPADKSTVFIVASKSGTTLEPNIFKEYFFEKSGRDGSRFIAITDPKSKMQSVAESDRFSRICYGDPTIGGRFSALSDFGMVPGAVMGLDIPRLLNRAVEMTHACREADASLNPGVSLGLALGTLARQGRDKVTLVASPAIYDLGAWLEQLIAESTGKNGRALIPVDREPLASAETYGKDRVFVHIRFSPMHDPAQDEALSLLEKSGQPVIRLAIHDRYDIGAEFLRWEVAVAVAGSVIGINPFDQPDVEASKIETRKITDAYKTTHQLPAETPILESNGLKFFTDEKNAAALKATDATGILRAHLNRIGASDYFALLAYIDMTNQNEERLSEMRLAVRDAKHAATCLGFGPRFLHSTGQAYKGGPNSGVILQVTCDDANDLEVPGEGFTFGVVKAAQARGDFEVLTSRGRRALRVHLPADVDAGLAALGKAIREALLH